MQGIILSNRRGRTTQYNNQYLIKIKDEKYKTKKDVISLLGKKIIFTTIGNKQIKGKISSPHGNKGIVRAIFEKGLPGTAISQTVEIK